MCMCIYVCLEGGGKGYKRVCVRKGIAVCGCVDVSGVLSVREMACELYIELQHEYCIYEESTALRQGNIIA
jgi:hypothetical protein